MQSGFAERVLKIALGTHASETAAKLERRAPSRHNAIDSHRAETVLGAPIADGVGFAGVSEAGQVLRTC